MQAGSQGEALRMVADRLRAEFSASGTLESSELRSTTLAQEGLTESLGAEDEALIASLRETLAAIASTLGASAEQPPLATLTAALDGAEFVMRGALAADDGDRLLKLMPSFVFLVALSVADQDRALKTAERATALIAELAG